MTRAKFTLTKYADHLVLTKWTFQNSSQRQRPTAVHDIQMIHKTSDHQNSLQGRCIRTRHSLASSACQTTRYKCHENAKLFAREQDRGSREQADPSRKTTNPLIPHDTAGGEGRGGGRQIKRGDGEGRWIREKETGRKVDKRGRGKVDERGEGEGGWERGGERQIRERGQGQVDERREGGGR